MTSTTSARTLPTPPPVPSYPVSSPSKKDTALKPNPHPYAIKTTSTALLTRSNSSGYNVNATYHYYIPSSPGPSPSRSDSGKGHRPSKSLNAVPESPSRESPRPLPVPPALDSPTLRRDGSGGYVSADEAASMPPRRPKRSETLPVIPLPSPRLTAPTPSVDDLPENPKLWTPSQLATYLTTALRITSTGKPGEIENIGLPPLVAKDIAAFTKNARIGGRTFLRLNEEDLESLGMNKKWRAALLAAARNLRQNVLKGRIWGPDAPEGSPSPPQSASPPSLFTHPTLNSSSSSLESSGSLSASEDECDGEGEISPGAALARSKARRYRNGRVRGMVESLERSGSFSEDGSEAGSSTNDNNERTHLRRWAREAAQLIAQRSQSQSQSPTRRRPLPPVPAHSRAAAGTGEEGGEGEGDEDEPTMEALLAQLAAEPVTGARAWEEMDLAPGVTVKRLPSGDAPTTVSVPVAVSVPASALAADPALAGTGAGTKTVVAGLGSGKSSGGSGKGKSERRVVTAIFAPASAEGSSASALNALEATTTKGLGLGLGLGLEDVNVDANASRPVSPERRPLPPTPGDPAAEGASTAPPANKFISASESAGAPAFGAEPETVLLERLLEEEIEATRALLSTFRARLEVVEMKVADLEEREAFRARREEVEAEAAAKEVERRQHEIQRLRERERERQEEQETGAVSSAPRESVEIGVQYTGVGVENQDRSHSTSAGDVLSSQLGSAFQSEEPLPDIQEQEQEQERSLILPGGVAFDSDNEDPASASAPPSSMPAKALQAVIPEVVRRLQSPVTLFSSTSGRAKPGEEGGEGGERDGPAHVSDLPSYVLLVGLGVCAVVIQVVLKKVVGKGAGLRP